MQCYGAVDISTLEIYTLEPDMPEFQINLGNAGEYFRAMDAFTQGYVEAMFFTEEENLHGASFGDMSAESLTRIVADCHNWQKSNLQLLLRTFANCDYGPRDAGLDYWYTSQGHGVGFWDRKELEVIDSGDTVEITFGELLSRAAGRSSKTLTWDDDVLYYE